MSLEKKLKTSKLKPNVLTCKAIINDLVIITEGYKDEHQVSPTHAEYVRVRLVGNGLGSSPGCGGFLSLSQTRLPSLRKGKESCRGVRGEVSGSGASAGEEASGSDIFTGYRLQVGVFGFLFFFTVLDLLR